MITAESIPKFSVLGTHGLEYIQHPTDLTLQQFPVLWEIPEYTIVKKQYLTIQLLDFNVMFIMHSLKSE